jgi:hypothetical protein
MSMSDSEKSRACNPSLQEAYVDFGEESCLFGKAERAYANIPCSEAMTMKPSCDCRTSFWKACVCFPVVLLRLRSTGLREACWLVSDSLQVRECAGEGENSWKEPCRCHRARRLSVRSVPVTQGKGDWQPKDCPSDGEGAFSWGGTCMWGMRVCGQ